MAEFLFEIGLEEVPARMLAGAETELRERVIRLLERERLLRAAPGAEPEIQSFATPRRLAVRVGGVAAQQEDVREELLGPSAAVAFRDGVPGPAALAFARKAGVAVEALERVTTAKGEYVRAMATKPGRGAMEVIAELLPAELHALHWAKTMYWRPAKPERFVRPVRWLLALLDGEVVPVSFAGRTAGKVTYGHRVLHGEAPVGVTQPQAYEGVLEAAFVVPDASARRQRIRKSLDRVCRTVKGARWREDHELVETVTQLTEWPSVILGSFDAGYLALPDEVLVTVMRDHQKYFATEDANGRLLPNFLAVLNTQVDAAGEAVIRHGNERVLRARFNDARFFWEFDQRTPLTERVPLLEKVTFQKDLGSYAAKTERVRGVCAALAETVQGNGGNVSPVALDAAALLAKTDLTTELVKEFTELQGKVGGLYALAQRVDDRAAWAIYDQYRPVGLQDVVPRSTEGSLLAIADKADTIAGMFALGMEPTGSKDPFGLRRAANGIVKVLAESELPLGLRDVAEAAAEGKPELIGRMLAFFGERLEFYLREARGQAYDAVAAVMAAGTDDVRDAVARALAVTEVREGEGAQDFAAVGAALKRMRNIVEQAEDKGITVPEHVDEALLVEPEETALAERSRDLAREVEVLHGQRSYAASLRLIATLRPQVDGFFDAVMVMVPEETVRGNRLALLQRVLKDLSRVADFSRIVTAS